jgi:hypothetical protein
MQPQIMEIIVGFTCGTPAVAKLNGCLGNDFDVAARAAYIAA